MNDPLHNLLTRADASYAPAPRRVDGLPQRVYRRHRRRQLVRSGAVMALLLSVALVGVVLQRISVPHVAQLEAGPPTAPQQDVALASLSIDADLHARTADLLRASERRREVMERSLVSLSRTDPRDEIRKQKNQFALTRVSEADRLADHPQRADDAMRIYQQTIELFPGTPAADIAARRLEQLQKT